MQLWVTPSPLSKTAPDVDDVEYKDSTGWDAKNKYSILCFSNKTFAIFCLFSLGLNNG